VSSPDWLEDRLRADGDTFVEEWRAACRIPSVSDDLDALEAMADWVEARLDRLFDRVERVPNPGYGPTLIATLDGSGPARLLVYTHYDVQPVGDAALWHSEPFEATIVDGAVVARGTCDDKSDITARLQALELWLGTLDGPPPYTIVWLCEGAEEIGSPGLDELLAARRDDLHADWCLWESFIRSADGRPEIGFGCRGAVHLELSLRTLASDQHSAFAPVFRSAALELAHALASLVDVRGNVLVDGFADAVATPTQAEYEAGLSVSPPGRDLGVGSASPYLGGLDERALADRLLYTPTVNVSAIAAGDPEGPGVVNAFARANVGLNLVPDQEPDELVRLVREHLDTHGFDDVVMTVRATRRPARSPVDTPLGRAAIAAARETMGEPVVYPLLPGAGPARVVLDVLGAPTVSPAGTTRLASGIHAPNENGTVADYLDHVRFSYRVLERLAAELR
jgi:acetylornithine deacetylase/succinyl-diaminopimelate desuccinylase-like protein